MNLQICTTAGQDILLRDVSTHFIGAEQLHVLFNNGKQQNYPLQNVRWYGPEEAVGKHDVMPNCNCDVCCDARESQIAAILNRQLQHRLSQHD